MVEAIAKAAALPARRRAPGRDVRRQRRRAGPRGARRGRGRARPLLAAAPLAGVADAREPGGRRRGSARAARARRPSSTRSTAPACRCTVPATRCACSPASCRTSPRACRRWSTGRGRCRCARPCSRARRWRCGRTAGRGRSRRRCGGWAAARTSRRSAASCRCRSFFFDLLYLEGEGPLVDAAVRRARRAAAAAGAGAVAAAEDRHRGRGRGASASSRPALAAGHEGVMAKSLVVALRGGAARLPLAEVEARTHARPRDPGGRAGQRPALAVAVEPPPRRARCGERAVRHARQDVQGPDRRDAAVADRQAARARGVERRLDGLRAPGAGGRDRLQRRAGVAALSRPASPCASPASSATGRRSRPSEADTLQAVREIFERQRA